MYYDVGAIYLFPFMFNNLFIHKCMSPKFEIRVWLTYSTLVRFEHYFKLNFCDSIIIIYEVMEHMVIFFSLFFSSRYIKYIFSIYIKINKCLNVIFHIIFFIFLLPEPKNIDLYEFLVESELQHYYNSMK